MTALAERRILGSRGSDGRVHAPPLEYDPVTHAPLTDLVEVSAVGTVLTWTWLPAPAGRPAADAPLRLGADPARRRRHRDAARRRRRHRPAAMRTGMRVRVRWAADPVGHIRDIACFEPGDGPGPPEPAPDRTVGRTGGRRRR